MAHVAIRHHTLLAPAARIREHQQAPRLLVVVRDVATCASMVVVVAALALGILVRTSGTGAVRLFGHEVRPVLSGSMAPAFRTGDAVVTTMATPERVGALTVGDVIVFRVPGHESMVVAHRVAKVVTNNLGARLFTTRGDANSSDDGAMVDGSHVIGVVTGSVPHLGNAMVNLGHRRTLVVFFLSALLASFSVTVARLAQQQLADERNQTQPRSGVIA